MIDHSCHAIDCRTFCRPEHLMCLDHWKLVPADLQRSLWRHYRRGQETGKRQPTKAWRLAAERCIVAVAVKERRLTEPDGKARVDALSSMLTPKAA